MKPFFFKYPTPFVTLLSIAGALLAGACTGEVPLERNEMILGDYPELAVSVIERDFEGLWEFTGDGNPYSSDLAWKAIAKSESNDLDGFVDYAIELDHPGAWFALSYHPLTEEHLENISTAFSSGATASDAVCEVFFRAGDGEMLRLLLARPEYIINNEKCALAVGGILVREQANEELIRSVYELAFQSDDPVIRRNLLYGFYRGELNRLPAESELLDDVAVMWENEIGRSPEVDQMMVRILGKKGMETVLNHKSFRDLKEEVQLSVEMARTFIYSDTEHLNRDYIEKFLSHPNPQVTLQMLESLQEHATVEHTLLEKIELDITRPTRNHELFILSLGLLQKHGIEIENYLQKLEFSAQQNPYLLDKILALYKTIDSEEVYLHRLQSFIEKGGIEGLNAVRALTTFWFENGDEDAPELKERVREISKRSLHDGDRSVVAGLSALLTHEALIEDEDIGWIEAAALRFEEAGEQEKLQVVREILEDRFPDRSEDRSGLENRPDFRIPDWDRLADMGTRPHWILETDRGSIEIRLDPFSAPFTVSSIDSLTRAGVYDGVRFHRVVKNFVIQGGDFDRRDGFGGPGYRIPTEPSFQSFERGKVGIASSGTDTEGSQFFIMHQWAPHLDGNYTLFGEVTRGMEVVDRIQIGDKLLRARISVR